MQDWRAVPVVGVTIGTWSDPQLGSLPSRINPVAGNPHRRYVVAVGVQVLIGADVDGVGLSPADAALGGRLFEAEMVEWPGASKPPVTFTPGMTSVQAWTPDALGHYTFIMRREGGGAVVMHFDATS